LNNQVFQRYSIGTDPVGINILMNAKKVLIKVETASLQVASDKGSFSSGQYFPLDSGTTIVLDADLATGVVPIEEILWFKTASGTATLSVWRMG